MFVPTIKYKRVNEVQDAVVNSVAQLQISNDLQSKTQSDLRSSSPPLEKSKNVSSTTVAKDESPVTKKEKQQEEKSLSKETLNEQDKTSTTKEETPSSAMPPKAIEPITAIINEDNEALDEPTIEVDPSDNEQIIVTLTNGKKYTADRYCPHAGADLSYLGEVGEDEFPPEIGPILSCTLHYWFFLLDKEGRSDNGHATINACPVPADQCPVGENNKKLDW